jgi:chromosomal replication initiator protein
MRISVRHIRDLVAGDFNVAPERLITPSKEWEASHPRQYAMLLARELTPLSYPALGRIFGYDHTTIIHGVRAAQKRVANDRSLALKLGARKLLLQSEAQPIFRWTA